MVAIFKRVLPLAIFATLAGHPAGASEISDVAHRFSLPVAVVETVFRNVDGYFSSNDAPGNRLAMPMITDKANAPANHQQSVRGITCTAWVDAHNAKPPNSQHGTNPSTAATSAPALSH